MAVVLISERTSAARRLTFRVFEFDASVEARDDQAFADAEATGERGLVFAGRWVAVFVPELAVGAVAVPAKIAVGDAAQREELKAAQQTVVLRHGDAPAQHLDLNQSIVRLVQVVVRHGATRLRPEVSKTPVSITEKL